MQTRHTVGPRVLSPSNYSYSLLFILLVLCLVGHTAAASPNTPNTPNSPFFEVGREIEAEVEIEGMTSHSTESENVKVNSTPLGPGTVPFDVDDYPVAPEGLELEQVHLYVRHGELQTPFTPCSGFWNVHVLSFTHTSYFLNA